MKRLNQIRICGFGGQGVVLAGAILGHAAIKDGKWVAGSSSYGAQARGGSARADVVIGEERIVYPHVVEADILITLSQTAYETYTKELAEGGLVIYDEQLVNPKGAGVYREVGVPATEAALRELGGKQAANIVILGASAAVTAMASREALVSSIVENVAERFKDLNLRALDLGYRLAEEVGKGAE
ncbi:MAG: 2-oxoacid:acceptor oxidoreductase family protein [Pseudomonadota bacterium]